jgi:hypothetical protein
MAAVALRNSRASNRKRMSLDHNQLQLFETPIEKCNDALEIPYFCPLMQDFNDIA